MHHASTFVASLQTQPSILSVNYTTSSVTHSLTVHKDKFKTPLQSSLLSKYKKNDDVFKMSTELPHCVLSW